MGVDGIASVIRRGRLGMPGFAGILDEQEILDVASFVRQSSREPDECPSDPGGPDLGHARHCAP